MKILIGQNKIRFLTKNNKSGDAIGITLPVEIQNTFPVGTHLNITIDERGIHLTSGCRLTRHDIRKQNRSQQPYAY